MQKILYLCSLKYIGVPGGINKQYTIYNNNEIFKLRINWCRRLYSTATYQSHCRHRQ